MLQGLGLDQQRLTDFGPPPSLGRPICAGHKCLSMWVALITSDAKGTIVYARLSSVVIKPMASGIS